MDKPNIPGGPPASSVANDFFVQPAAPDTESAPVAVQRGIWARRREGVGTNPSSQSYDFIPQLEVYLKLPSVGFKKVDPFDKELRKTLIKAAEDCHVSLSFDDAPAGFAILRGWTKDKIDKARKAIHFLLTVVTTESEGQARYIIEAPVAGRDALLLSFQSTERGGRRATLPNLPVLAVCNADTAVADYTQDLAEQFRQCFRTLTGYLRQIPEGMVMRVHFGLAHFKQLKVQHHNLPIADFPNLASRVAERGTGDFQNDFGHLDFAARVRATISTSFSHVFQPGWMPEVESGVHKAKHTLIFVVKGLLFEVPLDVHIKSTAPAVQSLKMNKNRSQPRNKQEGIPQCDIGSYRAFRREDGHHSCEIIACCPQRSQDWRLDILKEENLKEIPFTVDDIRKSVKFKFHSAADEHFPIPQVAAGFAMGKVDDTVLKSTWTFELKGAPHVSIEVSQHRHWRKNETSKPPNTSTGVCMRSAIWDDQLAPALIQTEPRQWPEDASNLFRKDPKGLDAFVVFMKQIDLVQGALEAVGKADIQS